MEKNRTRTTTNQPGVYKNQKSGKYDVKHSYTEYDPISNEKKRKSKWIYGINSYKEAVKTLANMKTETVKMSAGEVTLQDALELWLKKAKANNYSITSIRNTQQQFNMIAKFWSPEAKLKYITENTYLDLISKCREYGYSEETVHNINACLRKLVKLAYRNRLLKENPFDYCDNARINPTMIKAVISHDEYLLLDQYFAEHSFWRLGENCYPKYRLLVRLLYWTGMRIGEVIALTYNDFKEFANGKMKVSVTKSYNSSYKLLKGTKNNKKRTIPLPESVMELYKPFLREHLEKGGDKNERLFSWDHGVCNVMIKKLAEKLELQNIIATHLDIRTLVI